MIVELTGLPGAGKTTICNLVSVPHGGKGSVSLLALRPSGALLKAAWHIAVLCASTRPFSWGRLKRGFNLTVFLRYYQDHQQTILLDQGIVQKLWSILGNASTFSMSRLDRLLASLRPFAPDHVVWIVTPADISTQRLMARHHGRSRLDRLPPEEAWALLIAMTGRLDLLVAGFDAMTGREGPRLDGRAPPEANASRIDELLKGNEQPMDDGA